VELAWVAAELHAQSYVLPAVETYFAAAAAHLHAGDRRLAMAVTARAGELWASVERLHTPGLHPPVVQDLLSRREREVAALASLGTARQTIASTLGLSGRTVEAYLRSARNKLGVNGDKGLADAFRSPFAS
jgi:DNA-binding NarL/FixJ family response regulator